MVVLIHGGFWRPQYDRTLMEPLARDVVARGWAAWNLDYRASGSGGGGWPATFEDVAAGIDALVPRPTRAAPRPRPGGHRRATRPAGASRSGRRPGPACPRTRPAPGRRSSRVLAVSQAGVNNLVAGAFEELGQRGGRGADGRAAGGGG